MDAHIAAQGRNVGIKEAGASQLHHHCAKEEMASAQGRVKGREGFPQAEGRTGPKGTLPRLAQNQSWAALRG